ncbi:MAG: T9SS type A sorting domain-containing protein [Chitinophagaceae bacterium]|nr:T9SS type A sorting domain-containing protein [Chitinophagaceae bacterium]
MKKRILHFIFLSAILSIVYFTNISFSTGPPDSAVTSGCTCHGAANANTVVNISFNNGTNLVYNNGQTYPVTVTVNSFSNQPGAGFALSYNIGTLTAVSPNTQIANGVWKHSSPKATTGLNPKTASWTANWTAPPTGSTLLQLKAAGNAVSLSNGSSLDQWNFASNLNIPLPVYFESFEISRNHGVPVLNWTVINESNIKGYLVERSTDGVNFSAIHEEPALNQIEKHAYKYTDPSGYLAPALYYRIVGKDLDGHDYYSMTQTLVSLQPEKRVSLVPNVVSANSSTTLISTNVLPDDQIILYSVFGQKLISVPLTASRQTLELVNIPTGLYLVVLNSDRNISLIDHLIIQ